MLQIKELFLELFLEVVRTLQSESENEPLNPEMDCQRLDDPFPHLSPPLVLLLHRLLRSGEDCIDATCLIRMTCIDKHQSDYSSADRTWRGVRGISGQGFKESLASEFSAMRFGASAMRWIRTFPRIAGA